MNTNSIIFMYCLKDNLNIANIIRDIPNWFGKNFESVNYGNTIKSESRNSKIGSYNEFRTKNGGLPSF